MAVPVRMCRVCRLRRPKTELTRWVKSSDGLKVDTGQQFQGRGYYTCSAGCAEKLPFVIRKTGR